MLMASRFNIVAVLSVCCLLGCVEDDLPAPPVMEAMDSMEALQKRKADEEMARIRKENASRTIESSDDRMETASLPPGVPSEGTFVVDFTSTAGNFTVEVNREWAPIGAHRFYELVKDGFYDDAGFFRVIPNFMVQFGLAADPLMTGKWKREIPDDPVVKSNTRGYVTFAKTGMPNSRTGQIFINYADNSRLDQDGFAPFGLVTKGMEAVDKINAEYREKPQQGSITSQGNAYLKKNFPNLDYVIKATIVKDDLAPAAEDDAQDTRASDADGSTDSEQRQPEDSAETAADK